MLYFVSAELALGYWLFAFLSALGALQWVATRYRLGGLAFLDYTTSRVQGYALAAFLVVAGAAGFFVSQWQAIFAPGPAGSELAVLFATSAFAALVATVVLAPLLEHWRTGAGPGASDGQTVAIGHATAQLFLPAGATALAPAICLLPACPLGVERAAPVAPAPGAEPGRPSRALPSLGQRGSGAQQAGTVEARYMAILGRHLAAEGMVALVVNPDEHSYVYPAVLAVLPAAVAALRERPEVDPTRIGALGEDLGADLVIRSASTSKEIKAVVALAPLFKSVPPGLDLLSEMSYFRAMRWARDRSRASLCQELNAAEFAARIPPRPFLLLYAEHDRLAGAIPPAFGQESTSQLRMLPGLGHLNLAGQPAVVQVVTEWLKEHL